MLGRNWWKGELFFFFFNFLALYVYLLLNLEQGFTGVVRVSVSIICDRGFLFLVLFLVLLCVCWSLYAGFLSVICLNVVRLMFLSKKNLAFGFSFYFVGFSDWFCFWVCASFVIAYCRAFKLVHGWAEWQKYLWIANSISLGFK